MGQADESKALLVSVLGNLFMGVLADVFGVTLDTVCGSIPGHGPAFLRQINAGQPSNEFSMRIFLFLSQSKSRKI